MIFNDPCCLAAADQSVLGTSPKSLFDGEIILGHVAVTHGFFCGASPCDFFPSFSQIIHPIVTFVRGILDSRDAGRVVYTTKSRNICI